VRSVSRAKRVLITGGSKGIGRAIAESVVAAGYSVHLVARNEARLRQVAGELSERGDVTYSALDLSNSNALQAFCRTWREELHGLVNNAGYWFEDSVSELDVERFTDLLSVNLVAPYILAKGLSGVLHDGGRIVNIASQLGTQGRVRMGAYSASKHGLVGLTKCWAPEVGLRGITVNAVCPGWVNTESNRTELVDLARDRHTTLEHEMEAIACTLTLKRFIEPREVADLVTFLLGDGGSGITGQVYEIK
jgi:NAD(P)-dependent dehydrogenase (short-subunit alcohol dehydrogenase family)